MLPIKILIEYFLLGSISVFWTNYYYWPGTLPNYVNISLNLYLRYRLLIFNKTILLLFKTQSYIAQLSVHYNTFSTLVINSHMQLIGYVSSCMTLKKSIGRLPNEFYTILLVPPIMVSLYIAVPTLPLLTSEMLIGPVTLIIEYLLQGIMFFFLETILYFQNLINRRRFPRASRRLNIVALLHSLLKLYGFTLFFK